MKTPDILERERAGEVISLNDPQYPRIAALITEAQRLAAEMNTGYRDPAEVRALFSRLSGTAVDESFWLLPPFHTDFVKNIRVGRNVIINHGVTVGQNAVVAANAVVTSDVPDNTVVGVIPARVIRRIDSAPSDSADAADA